MRLYLPSLGWPSVIVGKTANRGSAASLLLHHQQCRHAGGGGRPGGKPTFNWKERKALKLDELASRKEFKIKPFGDFDDLKPFFDEKVGDVTIDLRSVDSFDDESLFPKQSLDDENDPKAAFKGENNTRKVVQISSLFGSKKTFGFYERPVDEKKLHFSKTRSLTKFKEMKR